MTSAAPADFASPAVARITGMLHRQLDGWHRADAQARVAVGQMLRQAKAQMSHGQWLQWLESQMPFRPRSAQLYMELAAWAADNPAVFEQLAPLGPSKLYVLFKLPAVRLARLMKRRYHTVPSSGLSLLLSQLSFQQFLEVLQSDKEPEKSEPSFADKLIATSEKQVSAMRATILKLIAYQSALPEEDVLEMYDTLEEALAWLAKAYEFEDDPPN